MYNTTLPFVQLIIFTNLNGNISAIDLDNASEYSYEIYINGVQATQFAVDDHIVRIVHNLGRLPDANDEFVFGQTRSRMGLCAFEYIIMLEMRLKQ